MKVIYINYINMETQTSGSSVRPYKMYKAFLKEGHDVFLITGSQNIDNIIQRRKIIENAIKRIKCDDFDICYIESPTYPIMFHSDISLIKTIHNKGIPIAYFYRDFYRKFPTLFPRRKGFINLIKGKLLDFLQYRTDKVLNNVDIIYLPSDESKKLFKYADMRVLPPAGEDLIEEKDNYYLKNIIYVGGISNHYGFDTLFDTFSILNRKKPIYSLTCICREQEWKKRESSIKNAPWLYVYHVSGDKLKKYYAAAAAAAVIPKKNNDYNKMAISVKLFEYMSYGLPVIAIGGSAMDRIIEKYDIGILTNDSPESLAKGIEKMLSNHSDYKKYKSNVECALRTENLWTHRVQKIVEDLLGKKNVNDNK